MALAGCGEDLSKAVTASGDWGWNEGAGCEGLQDALRIEDGWITFYQSGQPVSRGKIVFRQAGNRTAVSTGVGRVNGATWRYVRPDLEDPSKLVLYEDRFSVSLFNAKLTSLILDQRWKRVDEGQDLFRMDDDPRIGNRLARCPTEEQNFDKE